MSFLDYDVYDKTVKNEKLEKYGCFTDVLKDKVFQNTSLTHVEEGRF